MAGPGRTTGAKRQKERQRAEKRVLKEEKKARRKAEKQEERPGSPDEDPDLQLVIELLARARDADVGAGAHHAEPVALVVDRVLVPDGGAERWADAAFS